MDEQKLENAAGSTSATAANFDFSGELDSCCSTPYLSAASSPARDASFVGFSYSAPASPTHFFLSVSATGTASYPTAAAGEVDSSFEFDFCGKLPSSDAALLESMTSADELFFNGQIRPVKLSTHLERPQILEQLISNDDGGEENQTFSRRRERKLRTGSLRRRARSMSPHRNADTSSLVWQDDVVPEKRRENEGEDEVSLSKNSGNADGGDGSKEKPPSASGLSSGGRSSGRWVFLKEFLYRSKSEGRNEGHKFWSFSPGKDKKPAKETHNTTTNSNDGKKKSPNNSSKISAAGKRRVPPPSPHELHYAAKRAQAEEMRKRTFLPYRQGLFGCLGFTSRSYGAMNGFARALNPAFKIRS